PRRSPTAKRRRIACVLNDSGSSESGLVLLPSGRLTPCPSPANPIHHCRVHHLLRVSEREATSARLAALRGERSGMQPPRARRSSCPSLAIGEVAAATIRQQPCRAPDRR